MTGVYRSLATNGGEPLAALKEAEARFLSTPKTTDIPPRPSAAPVASRSAAAPAAAPAAVAQAIVRPENTSTQQWFTQNLCSGTGVADTVLNPTEGEAMSWTPASNYDAYAFTDSSAPGADLWGWTP